MMPRRVPVCVCVCCGGGRSHGCKSTPDSVNVSEIQPSMERPTSAVHVQAPENLTGHVRLSYFIICIPAFCRSLHILDSG